MTKKKIASEVIILERQFEVFLEEDEDGNFVASVPDLNGCDAQAKTLNEVRVEISKVAWQYLDSMPGRLKIDMDYRKE